MNNIQALCNKLNEADIKPPKFSMWHAKYNEDSQWDVNYDLIQNLNFLPAENFQKILEMSYNRYSNIADILKTWGTRGYLKFEPYIITENLGTPILVIKYNKFLHLYRKMYFQVSETPYGMSDAGHGSVLLTGILNGATDDLLDEQFLNLLVYAAFFDAGWAYDSFRDWCVSHPKELSDFVKTSVRQQYGIELKYDWESLKRFIYYATDWVNPARQIYRVPKAGGGTLFEFAFGVHTIQVKRTLGDGKISFLTLNIPAVVGTALKDRDEETMQMAEELKESSDCNMCLLLYAICFAGFKLNWITSYAIDKDLASVTFKCTNAPGVHIVENLNDVYNCEPDEY